MVDGKRFTIFIIFMEQVLITHNFVCKLITEMLCFWQYLLYMIKQIFGLSAIKSWTRWCRALVIAVNNETIFLEAYLGKQLLEFEFCSLISQLVKARSWILYTGDNGLVMTMPQGVSMEVDCLHDVAAHGIFHTKDDHKGNTSSCCRAIRSQTEGGNRSESQNKFIRHTPAWSVPVLSINLASFFGRPLTVLHLLFWQPSLSTRLAVRSLLLLPESFLGLWIFTSASTAASTLAQCSNLALGNCFSSETLTSTGTPLSTNGATGESCPAWKLSENALESHALGSKEDTFTGLLREMPPSAVIRSGWSKQTTRESDSWKIFPSRCSLQKELGQRVQSFLARFPHFGRSQWCHGQSHLPANSHLHMM